MPMRYGILKSLTHILNESYDWTKHGLYYKIQVTPAVKIGFRKPYEKYLGTHVSLERKLDRKGRWRPGVYTVFARNGNPIFIAHRRWFSSMSDEDGMLNTVDVAPVPSGMIGSTASMAASGIIVPKAGPPTAERYTPVAQKPKAEPETLGDVSWEELFDI